MTNTKSTKRALLTSVMALFLCFAMLLGTTWAWFTDSVNSTNNIIKSGNLDVELYWSTDAENWNKLDENTNVFSESYWEPGHTEVVYLKIVNEGTLALKYQLGVTVASEKSGTNVYDKKFLLSEYIQYGAVMSSNVTKLEDRDQALKAVSNAPIKYLYEPFLHKNVLLDAGESVYASLIVYMPESVGNDANHKTSEDSNDPNKYTPVINLGINLIATQHAYEEDSFGSDYDAEATYWDARADTSWYNAEADVFSLTTPQQFAGLASLIDGGETFEGKTVKLSADIDLAGHQFNPIGSYRKDLAFKGVFDGQGNTVKNLEQNTWALNNGYYYGDLGLGLFGMVEDATIKNLNVDNASISGESAIVGIVAGTAYGECTFENITVKNSKGNDYQYYAGGVVGWASGDHTYKNINIDASTTIGSQWGDFGNANGGIIGGAGTSGTYHFEDCTVACRIDATNDVVSAYQWYCYRNSGMLIGKVGPETIVNGAYTVTADNVTCKNVTVIYGDWANYTYCEFAGTGYPYVRVQAGVSVDGYSNVRYGHPTDANGNIVVDDNHVHNDGEAHHKLIAFDQLLGGPANARYCYYGISEHPGVTVVYPTTKDTIAGAFEVDDGSGNKTDIKGKINNVVFGKTSEYPEIVDNNTPVSNEKGVATYQVPNGSNYDVYYLSENQIILPADSKNMFADLKNMTELDATNLDMSQVENALCMFVNCSNLETIEGIEDWDMSNVTNMQSIFYGCNKLKDIDVSEWDTSNVTNMRMVFFRCYALTNEDLKGVENWDVSNVTNFYSMFKHARGLTSLDLSKWDTSNATNMSHMFANIGGVEKLDLSSFDTSKVTDMSWMFYDASKLTTIYVGDGWSLASIDPAKPTAFYNNQALVGGNGTTWLDVCDMANPARPWESSAKLDYAIVDGTNGNPGLFTYKAN